MPFRHPIVATAALLVAVAVRAGADCPCGPLYCLNDPTFPSRMTKKKAKLSSEYPPRLVALLDRTGKCLVCVENTPDGFSLKVVENNGDSQILGWTQDGEDLAKRQLEQKKIRAYYIMNAAEACTCCEEPKARERPDWDSKLELNRDVVLSFERK